MKKVLRFIGILLLIIVAGVLILGLVAPKEMKTERTVMINAPKSVVANQMFQYKHFSNWSPWASLDSNMKTEVIGQEGVVGTKYVWEGNKDVGKGEMVTKAIRDGEMDVDIHFKEPWESNAAAVWKVEDAGNGKSKATWGFTTKLSYPMNGIMMLMGMRKMLEKDFDKGLDNLKTYAETHAHDTAVIGNWNIQDVQFPGHTYATIRKVMPIDMEAMNKFFSESYSQLGQAAGNRINGPASGIFYSWDEEHQQTDMAAGFPVSGTEPVHGATMATVDPSKAYMIVYTGGYSGSGEAHMALSNHMKDNNQEMGLVIEEYIKGPGEENDSTKWVTNIYYLHK